MESFTVRRNMPEPSWGILDETALLLINEMRGTLEHFCVIAAALVAGLARFFSQELEVAATRKSLGEWSLLQLNYARPSQTQARFINQAHEDGCLLTVASNTAQGLEIEVNRKSYTSVSIKPNQIVIMPGEILWLLSGGQIPPCYHRVRAAADVTERMSLLLFGDLNPARCSPWVSAENNRHIDIGERVLKNSRRFGLKEWGPEERL
jgi:isopenicillin N synthase-like dioxygenase